MKASEASSWRYHHDLHNARSCHSVCKRLHRNHPWVHRCKGVTRSMEIIELDLIFIGIGAGVTLYIVPYLFSFAIKRIFDLGGR